MRFTVRIVGIMRMLVMFVMRMSMCVFEHFVNMVMLVTFGDVEIHPDDHENCRTDELPG